MSSLKVICVCAALGIAAAASGQGRPDRIYKIVVVALTEDPALRADFERQLVAKAREHNYDAVTSYDLVPTITDVDNREFVDTMLANKIDLVLLVRPAAIGPDSSLDSVRKEVNAKTLTDMRDFAKKVSNSNGDDLIAVVHLAVYLFYGRDPEVISSGAVWLDEPVQDRAEGHRAAARLGAREPRRRTAGHPSFLQAAGAAWDPRVPVRKPTYVPGGARLYSQPPRASLAWPSACALLQ